LPAEVHHVDDSPSALSHLAGKICDKLAKSLSATASIMQNRVSFGSWWTDYERLRMKGSGSGPMLPTALNKWPDVHRILCLRHPKSNKIGGRCQRSIT
jgi:hypothetical protein